MRPAAAVCVARSFVLCVAAAVGFWPVCIGFFAVPYSAPSSCILGSENHRPVRGCVIAGLSDHWCLPLPVCKCDSCLPSGARIPLEFEIVLRLTMKSSVDSPGIVLAGGV